MSARARISTISRISSAGSTAIRERPATVRAYELAKEINTQNVMTEEAKKILFGQTASVVKG